MATISIARKHKLTQRKAKAAAERIAKDLQKRFGLEYAWDGNRIAFERAGITGTMNVGKDNIALDVTLGWLLAPLKPNIERAIVAQLDELTDDA